MWDYTPAQAWAFEFIANKRLKRERALDLSIHAMAFRAEGKDINSKVRTDMQDN